MLMFLFLLLSSVSVSNKSSTKKKIDELISNLENIHKDISAFKEDIIVKTKELEKKVTENEMTIQLLKNYVNKKIRK